MSHIPTQSGGAWNEMTGKNNVGYISISKFMLILHLVLKMNRMMEIAFENDLPLLSLVQSVRLFGLFLISDDEIAATELISHRPVSSFPNNSAYSTKEVSSSGTWPSAHSTENHRVQLYSDLQPREAHTIQPCRTIPSSSRIKAKHILEDHLW